MPCQPDSYFLSSKSGVNFHKWGRVYQNTSTLLTSLTSQQATQNKKAKGGGGGGLFEHPPNTCLMTALHLIKPFKWPQSLVLITAIYTLLGLTRRPCMVRGLILFLLVKEEITNNTYTQITHSLNTHIPIIIHTHTTQTHAQI